MYAAVATLQMAARRLQLSGELDQSKYARMMSQLREVTDELYQPSEGVTLFWLPFGPLP